ncbi:Ger(x)C family spore germination protein [Bacillus sp. AFS055030]|uniref:Ger(x)C family spore germination protein n=1 Tax=Bacillus sp. AFS055030 TaxID=2033507 RepID=UPI000BFB9469|nr:Ger(x)C family spore germination protein [Bacillus sp. AFS055030]PGL72572.1 hypothetical protein CN925_04255 [Bacillus sp. AFS055030]
MKTFLLIFVVSLGILLNGCSLVPSSDVNELNLIEGAGFDLDKTGMLRGTAVFPIFRPNAESIFKVTSASGETIKKIRERLDSKVRYRLISGQLRFVSFSLELAKKGIFPIVDTFNRDPSVGSVLQLAIFDGETEDLLSFKPLKKENSALFLHDLLIHNSDKGPVPYTDFSTFIYQYFEVGQDPYLPVLKIDKDRVKISGLAIFKKDKVVTVIPWKYAFIFKTIMEKYKQGLHQFKIDGEYIAIDNINSKTKIGVKVKKGIPKFTISTSIKARIQEFTGPEPLLIPKNINKLEKTIEKDLEKQSQELLSLLQKNNVDPFGFGSKLEAHYRGFDVKKWTKQYPNVKIKVKAKVNILHSGVVE